jgi:DNA helicase II / ATP-dependent DNA helicase PcrA
MKYKKFNEEYSKLNKDQKYAVDSIDGPVMVIAGPGTGKTTILTLRIANILKLTDTPASGILALTFTEAGVKAMRNKLKSIIGERAYDVPIHTFHGFGSSIINELGEHFIHLRGSKQITEIESEDLLRKILKNSKYKILRPLGDPDFYISKIIGAISDSKQEAWTPDMVIDYAKSEIVAINKDEENLSTKGRTKGLLKGEALKRIERCEKTIVFGEVYREYELKKKADKKIDFDDLIFELLQALRNDQLLLQIIQEKYLYILVDEHQDTNDSQNLIVKTIADFFDNPNLFIVGDEKQAIYRFQGASVDNFLSFQKTWSQMKIISLVQNYRSHQGILDSTFNMIEKNYSNDEHENLRVKLKTNNKIKVRPIDIVKTKDINSEENFIVQKIKDLIEEESSIAIIVRKNAQVGRIFNLLQKNNIESSAERGANIFTHYIGEIFFSLLEFLHNPSNTESFAETIAGGLWDLDFKKRIEYIKQIRSGNADFIEDSIIEVNKLLKNIDINGVINYIILAGNISGLSKMVSSNPLSMEIWRGIIALSEEIARSKEIDNPRTLIRELLLYKKTAERRFIKINTGQTNSRIIIMTAHSSKGLEFDYVFTPYTTEESWITKNHNSYFVLPKEKEDLDDIRDERRLYYVALTRAKKHIFISTHIENSAGKPTTILRFIDDLPKDLVKETIIERVEMIDVEKKIIDLDYGKNLERNEYAKRILIEKGLSVTALNHFVKCPKEFYYKSILKVPEAPSPSSEKGNAMHEALSEVWKYKETDLEKISKTIKRTVKNYIKKSILPVHEKKQIEEELLRDSDKIAKSLVNHFNTKGEIKTESWAESIINHKFNNEDLEIKIHGKLDVIINTQNKILVYDYKTREAMSEKAIKGETEKSDGGYFRQLVFYKILLRKLIKIDKKEIEPSLVFIKPNKKGDCKIISLEIKKDDEERVEREIKRLIEVVWSGKILQNNCNNPECRFCKMY